MRIAKKVLARAQKVLRTVIPTRVYRPVLGSVLVQDGYAIGTDLEHTVRVALASGAQLEPAFLVPWAQFKAIKGDVDITPVLDDPDRPKVRIGGALLESFPLDDFPTVPEEAPAPLHEIDIDRLLLHLRRCDVVRARDDNARALLTAIAVEEDGAFVATDGFAAYVSDPDPAGEVLARVAGGHGILPGVTARILTAFGWEHAMAGSETQTWTSTSYAGGEKKEIAHSGVIWAFASDGEAVWLKGLEGKYFPVRDLVPQTFPHSATFDREELLAACTQAARVVTEAPHPLTLQIRGGAARLYAKSEGNELDLNLTASTTGEPIDIPFNALQLHSALRRIADGRETVTLECSGLTSLGRIDVGGGAYLQMPLQLPDDCEVPVRRASAPTAHTEGPEEPASDVARTGQEPRGVGCESAVTATVERAAGSDPVPAATPGACEPGAEGTPDSEVTAAVATEPSEVVGEDEVAQLLGRAQQRIADARKRLQRLLASA